MSNHIDTYCIRDIFSSGDYIIPIYQRNYAWGEPEISQLIQDIYDFAISEKSTENESNYYIGTLVVYKRSQANHKIFFETIDGQQRLTTLNILISVLNREYSSIITDKIDYSLNLFFDSRKKSSETLDVIARETNHLQYDKTNPERYNPNIQQAYNDAKKKLNQLLKSDNQIKAFYNFLADKVHIMRVSVPEDTDLNHYFEIMNTRGEQLEKHEILKAKLLEFIHHNEEMSYTFNLIWEACSDMERYVQYGFNVKQRDIIFTKRNWNEVYFNDLDEIAADLFDKRDTKEPAEGRFEGGIIDAIEFTGSFNFDQSQDKEAPDRFTSIINFSNFLLHVLRIQTEEDISLDDKRLLDIFDEVLEHYDTEEKVEFVKDFGANLLWCKWLFDNYIIKREFIREEDQWSLKKLKWYPDKRIKSGRVSYVNTFGGAEETNGVNKELVMLLSMFHVSTPTLVYKHWLNAALYYVYSKFWEGETIKPTEYIEYLTQLARAFLFDRYLTKQDKVIDYYDIIYKNQATAQNKNRPENISLEVLDKGTSVENFVFNYLDLILWKNEVERSSEFEFAFRSSVEHYYPQNPIAKGQELEQSICDKFGNLCLISSSKNSKLSHHLPQAKKDYYHKSGVDSLKQSEMMNYTDWNIKEIEEHGALMIEKLLNY